MVANDSIEREFLFPRHVAKIIGVRVETVHEWIRSGELPASDLSKRGSKLPRFFVRRSDVDEFMRRRAVHAHAPAGKGVAHAG